MTLMCSFSEISRFVAPVVSSRSTASSAGVSSAEDASPTVTEGVNMADGVPGSLLVTLTAAGDSFAMTLLFDCEAPPLSPRAVRICREAGLKEERWEEDGVGYLRLTLNLQDHPADPAPEGPPQKGPAMDGRTLHEQL